MDEPVSLTEVDSAPCPADTLLCGLRVVCLTDGCASSQILSILRALGAQTIAISAARGEPAKEWSSEGWLASFGMNVVIDVESEAGREIVRRVVRTADVLLMPSGAGDALPMYLNLEQFAAVNPGLVTVCTPGVPRTDRIAWEVGVLLSGLWYRDRNNGKGARVVVDDRPRPTQCGQGAPCGCDKQTQTEVEHLLRSIGFIATEIDEMISASVIWLKGGV